MVAPTSFAAANFLFDSDSSPFLFGHGGGASAITEPGTETETFYDTFSLIEDTF
jgi:hypothetical protein